MKSINNNNPQAINEAENDVQREIEEQNGYTIAQEVEIIVLVVLMVALCAYIFVFITGQKKANESISTTAQAVLNDIQGGKLKDSEEYKAAMQYMQASQQAFSESNTTSMLSIVYAVATAVIIGYGARVLRLGDEEKKQILTTKVQLDKMVEDAKDKGTKLNSQLKK